MAFELRVLLTNSRSFVFEINIAFSFGVAVIKRGGK